MSSIEPAEIEHLFNENGAILDEKLAVECASICKMYGLSAEDLLYKAQAFNYTSTGTRSQIAPITMDTLAAIKKQMQQSLVKASAAKAKVQHGTAQVDRSRMPNQRFAPKPPAPSAVKREDLAESSSAGLSPLSTTNVLFSGPPNDTEAKKQRGYRYMYEKISERSESLDQIIDDFADLIRAHYDLKEDFGDPAGSTDEEVVIVGRITHDVETASTSKLAEGAIVIESSRMLSGGSRTSLKLDPSIKIRGSVKGIGGFGLYPGEIAAFKGKNGGGGYFLATEYLAIPPLKPSPAALGIVGPKLDPLASQNPASIFVACGPFTSDSDVGYKPWRALLHQIKAKKPDVVLLVGPLVDSAHPKIKTGDLDVSPTNLFKAHFGDPLKAFLRTSPGSIVLVVPSVRDLVSDHAAFPQPELKAELFEHNPRIYLLPNPARFTINDISFAATSVDTLFHLRKEEYFKRGVEVEPLDPAPDDLPTDAMANLCRHLLLQRSFYPIFPPPQDLSSEVNLDMSHIDATRIVDDGELDYAPDLLIVPSRLKQFSKVVHSTTTLNPSFISKGTYGLISIKPRVSGAPKDRLTAEVVKIEVPHAGPAVGPQPVPAV